MCGGIAGMLCGKRGDPSHIAAYNAGRIASYALFGAIAGGIGATAASFPLGDMRLGLRIFAAAIAVFAGLRLLGIVPEGKSTAFRWLRPIAQKLLPIRSPWHALALGAIWGWLPCGMVYAAITLALASETVSGGALVMLAFGAGTLPVMLSIGTLASKLGSLLARPCIRRLSGAALVVSGVMGVIGGAALSEEHRDPSGEIRCH
jgi:sulfite exporter TauE/SafE